MQSAQDTGAQQLAERTRSGVEEMEKIVAMTGLDLERMLDVAADAMEPNKGGPFISPPTGADSVATEIVMASVADLDSAVARLERLQLVMRSLPITAPHDNFYTTSGPTRSTARSRCMRGSIWSARPARPCWRRPPVPSSMPTGRVSTAVWSRSITGSASPRVTRI